MLTHETGEPLERPGDSNVVVNLDEDTLGGVDVHLQSASLVERRVEQREQTLFKRGSSRERS